MQTKYSNQTFDLIKSGTNFFSVYLFTGVGSLEMWSTEVSRGPLNPIWRTLSGLTRLVFNLDRAEIGKARRVKSAGTINKKHSLQFLKRGAANINLVKQVLIFRS